MIDAEWMSALGQKQTFAVQTAMSASLPKADICSAQAHVRYGPKADIRLSLRLGIYSEAILLNRGSRDKQSDAVSRFHAAHVPARLFWPHHDDTSRDVLEQA